ncbi:lycopene cyclase family protein [Pelagibacteraceae bacterium]|nr:lycopene cyclase family protein [Pelagibacteraceae bacterium]
MKIYKAAIIGLGPSGLAVNKLIYGNCTDEIISFEKTNINNRNNYFGFWLTDWMKPFEKIIEKKWNYWTISNQNKNITHNSDKRPYCVISYKTWKNYCLNTKNNLNIVNKNVAQYLPVKNYFKIITEDKEEYYAEKIYDSRSKKEKKDELVQHFLGINILVSDNTFNDNKLTLMHFTNDKDVLHFIYILPFSHNRALVESTVFSKETYDDFWYREKIDNYLEEKKIKKIKEYSTEKGVIPMFFLDNKVSKNPNIFNIGIRGGVCKPSTGYAFSFLIKQIQLIKKSTKNFVKVHNFLDRKMDKIFINYLKNNIENGSSFIKLASNLNGYEFQSFMMGESSLVTKLKIIRSMPKLAFIKEIFKNK